MIHEHNGRDQDEFEDIFLEASEVLASPPTTGGKGPGTPAPASNENRHHNEGGSGADLADEVQLDAEHDEYARQALAEQEAGDATLDASASNVSHPQDSAVEGGEAREGSSTGQAAPIPYSERPISLYESPVKSVRHLNRCHTTMAALHAMVVEGAWKDDVENLRENVSHKKELGEDGKKTPAARAYDRAKLALTPYFAAGGSFLEGQRKKEALATSSGIRMMDVDSLTAEEAIALRERAKGLQYCVAAWLSSSGLGVHFYLAQDPAPDASNDHASWEVLAAALERDLEVKIEAQDASVKDISRACFGSYDPDACLNPEAVPLAWTPPAPEEEEEEAEGTEPAVPAQRVKPLTVADNTGDAEGMSKSDWSLHAADCENRPGFKADWEKIFAFDRLDLEDQSVPAYETQLVTLLVSAGWGEPEETACAWDIGPTHRAMLELRKAARQADKPVKDKQPHYFQVVIEKAIQDLMSRRAAGNGKKKRKNGKNGKANGRNRIQDAAITERERMDLETALEFLAQEKVGEDDNLLLAVGKCLKAKGHSFAEFDAWAARAGCICTDRPNRWKSFHARDRDYSAIIGMAVNMGCKLGLQTWQQCGRWLGGRYALEYRYDSLREEWWRWIGNRWTNAKGALPTGLTKRLGDEIGPLDRELAELSGSFLDKDGNEVRLLRLTEKTLDKVRPQGITRGLQLALDRPFPDYSSDDAARETRSRLLATATGVVDLATGKIEAHNPLKHDTRAVTAGGYYPDDIEDAKALLWDRLKLVLDERQFGVFLTYLGMTVSGQGQSYRSVIICQGTDGSGKDGLNFLLKSSWGGRAQTLPMSLLERATREIDVTRYTLMRNQPLFLLLDENGDINTSTLNTITGNASLPAARLPYMAQGYEDTIPGVIWWATVETPALTRKTGIDRRLGYLAFGRQIADKDKDARQWHTQGLKDAMVTMGVHQAIRWLRREIKDPKAPIPWEVLADMDPLQHFISTLDPGQYEGALVSKAHEDVSKLLGKPISATKFGTAVSKNDTWEKVMASSGDHTGRMILRIRKADSWG